LIHNQPALKPILMSAIISAMLAPSVAPSRGDAILASTIDPVAAQKALQAAISGFETAGWASATGVSVSAYPAEAITGANISSSSDPVMNEELMARLVKYTRGNTGLGALSAPICKELKVCDGTAALELQVVKSDAPNGTHYFGVPISPESKDVLFVVMYDWGVEAYLTDKTGKLKAAVVSRNGVAGRISNEKAADGYKRELTLFASEASDLPPTDTSVASTN
jgi:hypothetical protein